MKHNDHKITYVCLLHCVINCHYGYEQSEDMYKKTYFYWFTVVTQGSAPGRFRGLGCSWQNFILHICKYFGTWGNINIWAHILRLWHMFLTYFLILSKFGKFFCDFEIFLKFWHYRQRNVLLDPVSSRLSDFWS